VITRKSGLAEMQASPFSFQITTNRQSSSRISRSYALPCSRQSVIDLCCRRRSEYCCLSIRHRIRHTAISASYSWRACNRHETLLASVRGVTFHLLVDSCFSTEHGWLLCCCHPFVAAQSSPTAEVGTTPQHLLDGIVDSNAFHFISRNRWPLAPD